MLEKMIVVTRTSDGVEAKVINEGEKEKLLDPRFDLRNHSPTGFEYGYCGSGPAQLSLAILAEMCNDKVAEHLYQQFKFDFISTLGHLNEFTIDQTYIENWVKEKEKNRCQ